MTEMYSTESFSLFMVYIFAFYTSWKEKLENFEISIQGVPNITRSFCIALIVIRTRIFDWFNTDTNDIKNHRNFNYVEKVSNYCIEILQGSCTGWRETKYSCFHEFTNRRLEIFENFKSANPASLRILPPLYRVSQMCTTFYSCFCELVIRWPKIFKIIFIQYVRKYCYSCTGCPAKFYRVIWNIRVFMSSIIYDWKFFKCWCSKVSQNKWLNVSNEQLLLTRGLKSAYMSHTTRSNTNEKFIRVSATLSLYDIKREKVLRKVEKNYQLDKKFEFVHFSS